MAVPFFMPHEYKSANARDERNGEDADAVEAGEGTVPLRIMAVPFFKPHEYKSATGFEPENTKDLAIAQSLPLSFY